MISSGTDQAGMDLGVLVSVLAVFTSHCSKRVTGVPDLLNPTLEIYKEAWDSEIPEVCK